VMKKPDVLVQWIPVIGIAGACSEAPIVSMVVVALTELPRCRSYGTPGVTSSVKPFLVKLTSRGLHGSNLPERRLWPTSCLATAGPTRLAGDWSGAKLSICMMVLLAAIPQLSPVCADL
jgi:hypothetical protein